MGFPTILWLWTLLAAAAAETASPPTLSIDQEHKLNNIIDALIGTGDFAGWVNLLSTTDPSTIPVSATLFVPSNDAISSFPASHGVGIVPFDPLLVPYHIVPQRLTFSELRHMGTHTRLPTLLQDRYIVVTNNSPSNFTVDNSRITQPDIFVNADFSVHGIEKVLDYSVYGGGPITATSQPSPKPRNGTDNGSHPNPSGKTLPDTKSRSASCLHSRFPAIFSGATVFVLIKIFVPAL
ncbi:FAS1 domain-containing protein SELMODRAFT_448915-like [Andrographis paniculata]|uniref:FAS1 domain-containing protein SELMODRAFT_448915-like n=1 Tax=Andrographis paniculata TaxID=175694 RepID=UPI0021E8FDA8|nr:FAS1 domain-containing protein SELMODRAFT_448915-like [Andrographis paniculata]